MSNPFALIWRLVRGYHVNGFVRVVSVPLACALFLFGRGAAFGQNSLAYQQPIFNMVRELAPMWMWAFWFFVSSALFLLTALTARLAFYVAGIALASSTLAAWITCIVIESRLNPDALLTDGALGYFIFAGVAVFGLSFAPRQLAAERPIVAVDDTGEVVTPLRRTA